MAFCCGMRVKKAAQQFEKMVEEASASEETTVESEQESSNTQEPLVPEATHTE